MVNSSFLTIIILLL